MNEQRSVTCNLCKPHTQQPLDAVFEHLREAHGVEPDIEEWPDGSPVVVDHTLEPADFTRE